MDSIYGKLEWSTVLAKDPTGEKRLLIPVRIEPVEDPVLLAAIINIDLVGMQEDKAIERLLAGVGESDSQANKPDYPSNTSISASSTANPSGINNSQSAAHYAEYSLGLLDRKPQRNHFNDHIVQNTILKNGQTHGFILSGPYQEWPRGVRFKLFHLLDEDLTGDDKQHSPELKPLNVEKSMVGRDPVRYLWELLAHELNCEAQEATIWALVQLGSVKIFLLINRLYLSGTCFTSLK